MAGISLAISLGSLLVIVVNFPIQKWLFLGTGILFTIILIGLWVRENNKMKMATLIVENKILQINSVVVSHKKGKRSKMEDSKGIEVLISYFGILLDSKIIKFNQEHIRLKAVEIQHGFISITYGTDEWIKNIRLICSILDEEQLKRLSEKFEYETGIKPTILL